MTQIVTAGLSAHCWQPDVRTPPSWVSTAAKGLVKRLRRKERSKTAVKVVKKVRKMTAAKGLVKTLRRKERRKTALRVVKKVRKMTERVVRATV